MMSTGPSVVLHSRCCVSDLSVVEFMTDDEQEISAVVAFHGGRDTT